MTIQDWGAVGEIIGGVGVVFTLAYLSIQIRQNTRSVRAAAAQALADRVGTTTATWAEAENAALLRRGLLGSESMSEDERFRFHMLVGMMLLNMDSMFHAHRDGVLSEELWRREQKTLRRNLASSAVQGIWKRANVSDSFRLYVEQEIQNGADSNV